MVTVSPVEALTSARAHVRGRMLRALPAPLVVAATGAVLAWLPFWRSDVALGLINVMVPVSFVAIGMVLIQDVHQRTTGALMLVAAPCYTMSWWWGWPPEWQIGPAPLLSFVLGYFWFICGGLALVRYPESFLISRWDRIYFGTMAAWVGVLKTALVLVSEPGWNGFADHAWWPTVWPNRVAFHVLESVFVPGISVLAVLLLPILLAKLRRSRGLERVDAVPVIVAACAVTVCGSAYLVVGWFELPDGVADGLRAATGVAALITPIAFLASVLQRGLLRSSVADLVLRLAQSPSVGDVENAVRETLQDPGLTLLFWLTDERIYADSAGRPTDADDPSRWRVDVNGRDGSPLAVLLLSPSLERHRSLVRSVVVAGSMALENGRLHAAVAAQLAEVRASRTRIVETAMDERRRLERDLHDGAQQSLLAVTTSLAQARLAVEPGSEAHAALDRARTDLRLAREELRDLARGIHPAVLSQAGIGPAIEAVAERLGLAVRMELRPGGISGPAESAVYFVVAEALTNVVKHAGADVVQVRVVREGDAVVVEVEDDGVGGARAGGGGTGLTGLTDRVRALGGDLSVESSPGRGTTVTAVVPCA